MTRRLAGLLFWILLAALIAANAIVIWHSLTVLRFWEDEAFNLTVPRNLLAGLGYTSDGTLSGSTLTPFDPRISTGPVVLLPVAAVLATGIDPVIGARLVPLGYWVLLLIGLGVIGRRLAGRFGALIAVALPLAFNTADSVSPIQGPADLLGETAAAALIVWALVVLPRRAWLAGLLLGLAVQAKLIALLALPAFVVALFLLAPPGRLRTRVLATLRRGILPLLLAAVPTVLMELFAVVSLGTGGYRTHVRELIAFVRSGGQLQQPTTIPEKLTTLANAWFVPWWLVVGTIVLAAVVVVLAALPWRDRDPQLLALGFGSAIGLLTFVGWWAQAAQLPLWVRHPSVGVFAFAPILAAIAVRAVATLWRGRAPGTAGEAVAAARGTFREARGTGGAARGTFATAQAGVAPASGTVEAVGATVEPAGAAAAADRSPVAPGRTPIRLLAAAAAAVLTLTVAGGAGGDTLRALQPSTVQTLAEQRVVSAQVADWVRHNDVHWMAALPWGVATSYVVLSGAHVGLADAPAMRGKPILTGGPCPAGAPLTSAPGANICAAP